MERKISSFTGILLVSIFLNNLSFCQAQHWEFGFHINPNISTQHYPDRTPYEPAVLFRQISARYFPATGFDAGLSAAYVLTPNLRLRSGLSSSLKRFSFALYPYKPNGEGGNKAGDLDIFYNFLFLELPLLIQYDLSVDRRINPYFWGGLATNILLKDYRTTKLVWGYAPTEFHTLAKTVDFRNAYYRTFNPAVWLGFGLNYSVNQHWRVTMEPILKWQLLPLDNLPDEYNLPDRRRLLSVGVNAGVVYQMSGKTKRITSKETANITDRGDSIQVLSTNRRTELGLNFSPTIRHVIMTHAKSENFPPPFEQYNVKRRPLLGWDIGVTVKYPLNTYFKVGTGAFISRMGFSYGPQYFTDFRGDDVAEAKLLYHFTYAEFPLLVQYQPKLKRTLEIYAKSGVGPVFLLNDYRTIQLQWGEISSEQEEDAKTYDAQNYYYRRLNLGLSMGGGIAWRISDRMGLAIEPLFKMHVLNLNIFKTPMRLENLPSRRYLYSTGLNLQIHYQLGR